MLNKVRLHQYGQQPISGPEFQALRAVPGPLILKGRFVVCDQRSAGKPEPLVRGS